MVDASSTERVAPGGDRLVTRFEAVARRHYRGVYNYAVGMCGDAEQAADLTQAVFERAWRGFGQLRSQRAARAWLYRIAANEFRQACRSSAPTVPIDDDEPEAAGMCPDPAAIIESDDLDQRVRRAVERLAPHLREVVLLHNLDGLKLSEVAGAIDVPLGTVKSRLAAAFRHLRRFLYDMEGDSA